MGADFAHAPALFGDLFQFLGRQGGELDETRGLRVHGANAQERNAGMAGNLQDVLDRPMDFTISRCSRVSTKAGAWSWYALAFSLSAM